MTGMIILIIGIFIFLCMMTIIALWLFIMLKGGEAPTVVVWIALVIFILLFITTLTVPFYMMSLHT